MVKHQQIISIARQQVNDVVENMLLLSGELEKTRDTDMKLVIENYMAKTMALIINILWQEAITTTSTRQHC